MDSTTVFHIGVVKGASGESPDAWKSVVALTEACTKQEQCQGLVGAGMVQVCCKLLLSGGAPDEAVCAMLELLRALADRSDGRARILEHLEALDQAKAGWSEGAQAGVMQLFASLASWEDSAPALGATRFLDAAVRALGRPEARHAVAALANVSQHVQAFPEGVLKRLVELASGAQQVGTRCDSLKALCNIATEPTMKDPCVDAGVLEAAIAALAALDATGAPHTTAQAYGSSLAMLLVAAEAGKRRAIRAEAVVPGLAVGALNAEGIFGADMVRNCDAALRSISDVEAARATVGRALLQRTEIMFRVLGGDRAVQASVQLLEEPEHTAGALNAIERALAGAGTPAMQALWNKTNIGERLVELALTRKDECGRRSWGLVARMAGELPPMRSFLGAMALQSKSLRERIAGDAALAELVDLGEP